jgi:hypothetical protein
VLLRDIAPSIVYSVKLENAPLIRKGDPEATRENLRLVLDGDPRAKRLFSTDPEAYRNALRALLLPAARL